MKYKWHILAIKKEKSKVQTVDSITPAAWGGIVALIQSLISTGVFGKQYPEMCPDGDGPTGTDGESNSSRNRLWKRELQKFVDEIGRPVSVCHFPPGTSKWNKIEHRIFSHITKNWRGRPLTSHEVVINLIANTTTNTGFKIQSLLNTEKYPTGIKISEQEMTAINLEKNSFHGEWNYMISFSQNQ